MDNYLLPFPIKSKLQSFVKKSDLLRTVQFLTDFLILNVQELRNLQHAWSGH